MAKNQFPNSVQKAHLRRRDLDILEKRRQRLGRGLDYFGLPSADMEDVKLWRRQLRRILAVERDSSLMLGLLRTAQQLQVRSKLIPIEGQLADVVKHLAMDV